MLLLPLSRFYGDNTRVRVENGKGQRRPLACLLYSVVRLFMLRPISRGRGGGALNLGGGDVCSLVWGNEFLDLLDETFSGLFMRRMGKKKQITTFCNISWPGLCRLCEVHGRVRDPAWKTLHVALGTSCNSEHVIDIQKQSQTPLRSPSHLLVVCFFEFFCMSERSRAPDFPDIPGSFL